MTENAVTPSSPQNTARPTWGETLRAYLEPASLRMFALGFSAGLPLLLVLGTLSFRLREAGLDRTTIGYLSWVGLAYGFKWCWSPLVDRLPIPLLTRWMGRRRSWLLLSQGAIMAALVGMALSDPRTGLNVVVWCALAVAFASATQDIALDAYRIESADTRHQGVLAATYQTGYRLAMIWAGAGVLWLAARAEVAPVASARTRSVNVPPTSTPIRHGACGRAADSAGVDMAACYRRGIGAYRRWVSPMGIADGYRRSRSNSVPCSPVATRRAHSLRPVRSAAGCRRGPLTWRGDPPHERRPAPARALCPHAGRRRL